MSTPLIDALVENHGFLRVDADTVDAFLDRNPYSVLFLAGDAERLVEVNDVAVILPELMKVFGEVLTPALVDRRSEMALKERFGTGAFPCLVFIRGRDVLGSVSRVLDWQDYLKEISAILVGDPSDPEPARKTPAGAAGDDTAARTARAGGLQ